MKPLLKKTQQQQIVSRKKKKPIPFDFVLEALNEKHPRAKAMFGATAVYIGEKIIFILYDGERYKSDRGVWVCTTREHHESLRLELPIMQTIRAFETPVTGWQNLPADSEEFESTVLHACELVLKNDPRIGRPPSKKRQVSLKKSKATDKRRRK